MAEDPSALRPSREEPLVHAGARRNAIARAALIAALCAAHGAAALEASRKQSVTFDEAAHLPAGLMYIRHGTFGLYHVNPPLSRVVAALPVLAMCPDLPSKSYMSGRPGARDEWSCAIEFMRLNAANYQRLMDQARWPMVLVSASGVLGLYFWGKWVRGPTSGFLAAAAWAACPTTLAFAGLVTPDISFVAATIWCGYAFARWLREPRWIRAAGSGALFGMALLTKSTALFLIPGFLLLALVVPSELHVSGRLRGIQLVSVVILGAVILNTGYLFEGLGQPLGKFEFVSDSLTAERIVGSPGPPDDRGHKVTTYRVERLNRFSDTWLGRVPVLLPKFFVMGIDLQQRDFENPPLKSYYWGRLHERGCWWYYLYGFSVKLPLGTLLLLAAAIFIRAIGSVTPERWQELPILVPALIMLVLVSIKTGMGQHMRYALGSVPLAILWASSVLTGLRGKQDRSHARIAESWRVPRTFLSIAIAASALLLNLQAASSIHPHYLAYFNPMAGGPARGGEHLLLSNLDWGQGLLALKDWMNEHPEAKPLKLAYFNFVDASIMEIEYSVPSFEPREGWHAVSVNYVRGMGFPCWNGRGGKELVPEGAYSFFQRLTPVATPGYSIYVYHVTKHDVERLNNE